MHLVVGATGMLGSEICRRLRQRGEAVRALVRADADTEKVAALRALGAELAEGDLRDRASLERACGGVRAVVSTATTIASRRAGDSFVASDRDGHLALIDAAEQAGAEHFVYLSFPELDADVPLQDAKREVERRLERGSIAYTILRPGLFAETWLSPVVGFDPQNAHARINGSGDKPVNWVSFRDVATVVVAALETPAARNTIIEFGGDYLSPLEVVRVFEETTGRSFTVEHVPEDALAEANAAATDELDKTFSGLGLSTARGHATDATASLAGLGIQPTTIRDYAASAAAGIG